MRWNKVRVRVKEDLYITRLQTRSREEVYQVPSQEGMREVCLPNQNAEMRKGSLVTEINLKRYDQLRQSHTDACEMKERDKGKNALFTF